MNSSESSEEPTASLSTDALLLSLHKVASTLLDEFRLFQDYLIAEDKKHDVDLRIYRKGLTAEFEALEGLVGNMKDSCHVTDDLDNIRPISKRAVLAKTTNIPHYQLWWSVAKQCRGIRALGRRVAVDRYESVHWKKQGRRTQNRGDEVQIDVTADDGHSWFKISSLTEKRLLFEMAKQGWEDYGDVSETDSGDGSGQCHSDLQSNTPAPKLELLRLAEALRFASRSVRVHYHHPCVHIILPNIPATPHPSVSALLADIRSTGTRVTHGTSNIHSNIDPPTPLLLSNLLPQMCPKLQRQCPPTATLNIDTSVLIALLSDQCHAPPSTLPTRPLHTVSQSYHAAICQQMAAEQCNPLLSTTIYPLLRGRELVCTTTAAQRAREIVSTMGTATERARAEILLPGLASGSRPDPAAEHRYGEHGEGYAQQWQALSTYRVPSELHLPIREIPVEISALLTQSHSPNDPSAYSAPRNDKSQGHDRIDNCEETWPAQPLARRLHSHMTRCGLLSELNASVLFLSWRHGLVTVTSNGLAVRAVEKALCEVLDALEAEAAENGGAGTADADFGYQVDMPRFWLVEESRSLVGKEKQV